MHARTFNKRIFTFSSCVASLADLLRHLDEIYCAVRRRRVERAFAEKIMLSVTAVNRCRYCAFVHASAARRAGVSDVELHQVMAHAFHDVPADEVVALAFAQHYAEQNGQLDAAAWQQFVEHYGPAVARDILAYIRAIMFGNLLGNTFDACMSRLAGRPAPRSNVLSEVGVLLVGTAGVLLGVVVWGLARLIRFIAFRSKIGVCH